MTITITIQTDNDAFVGNTKAEVLRILKETFKPGNGMLKTMDGKKLLDINGNTVGSVLIRE